MPVGLPDPKEMGRLMALAQVGLEMVVPIGAGLLPDSYVGWSPWGIVGGTVLGFFGGLYHLLVMLKRFEKNEPPGPNQDK
jgi:F0F1-type ATP synthase assembly protein I